MSHVWCSSVRPDRAQRCFVSVVLCTPSAIMMDIFLAEDQPIEASNHMAVFAHHLCIVKACCPGTIMAVSDTIDDSKLPRIAITFCTQCKWMLRAAYFGQELLSTFGTTIGEVALIPATGGIFQVNLTYQAAAAAEASAELQTTQILIWDRKTQGGFPETKILKQLIRNHIDPDKNLGHSDTAAKSSKPGVEKDTGDPLLKQTETTTTTSAQGQNKGSVECTDCA